MLNVWKKFLTLEAAFLTFFNKKGPTPELSAQVVCGIPGVAGNQTERFGGRQVEKRVWPILLSLITMNPSLKNFSPQKGPCIKLGGPMALAAGAFLVVFQLWLGYREVPHL